MTTRKKWVVILHILYVKGPVTSRDIYNESNLSLGRASNILRQLWIWGFASRKKEKDLQGRHGVIYRYQISLRGVNKLIYHGLLTEEGPKIY